MSRGRGRVERAILDGLTDEAVPVLQVARDAGYDITRRSVHQSFTRAAINLYDQDLLSAVYVGLSGRSTASPASWRRVLCVRTPGPVDSRAAAQRAREFYDSIEPPGLAEFVMDKLDRGRWAIVDTLTGQRIDHEAAWKDSQ